MTPQQLATLRVAIEADPVLAAKPLNSDGYYETAQILNTEIAVPDFWVWRQQVSVLAIMGPGFDWTRVDNMTVGEARIWDFMTRVGVVDPSEPSIRAGVNEAFKGTAEDNTMRLAIFGHMQELATRTKRLYATGTGTTTTNVGQGPGQIVIATISSSDVQQARELQQARRLS